MMASSTARLASHLKQVKLNSMYNKQVSYARAINLSAGCAALPLPVLERAQKEFLDTRDLGMSITELGYRTRHFHVEMEEAEASFRQLMRVPDNYEVGLRLLGAYYLYRPFKPIFAQVHCIKRRPLVPKIKKFVGYEFL